PRSRTPLTTPVSPRRGSSHLSIRSPRPASVRARLPSDVRFNPLAVVLHPLAVVLAGRVRVDPTARTRPCSVIFLTSAIADQPSSAPEIHNRTWSSTEQLRRR